MTISSIVATAVYILRMVGKFLYGPMHDPEHVTYTLRAFSEIQEKLKEGKYKGNEIKNMAIH